MNENKIIDFVTAVLDNMPQVWEDLTTHRLDIYDEKLAKTQFLEQFEVLFNENKFDRHSLSELPTAYDYIRLGHPLSCILEWTIAKLHNLEPKNIISFSSKTIPILAILRKNLLIDKQTQINYTGDLPDAFDTKLLKTIYGYSFELKKVENASAVLNFEGSNIFISERDEISNFYSNSHIDFSINVNPFGSILLVHDKENNKDYISEIQHVRRRETIAMTPTNCLHALYTIIRKYDSDTRNNLESDKKMVIDTIQYVTGSNTKALVGSSGLSIQYAIMMGLVHDAIESHPGTAIKFIVPPNCYGGTNDQARRIATCIKNVEIVDLPVDGDNNMVESIEIVLDKIANEDAIPYIIAEIPTNPRVEVPDLKELRNALSKTRKTGKGDIAVDPVFILDQTFCPNVQFLGDKKILSEVRTITYVSGSKFPSGGKCTAGYCIGNEKTKDLIDKIETHLILCDNEATELQYEILSKLLPSMNQRILDAYQKTREFVSFISNTLPNAKINFVSEELAEEGFIPSVFSLDLPTKGKTDEERESYKRELNHKLIHLMITEIPDESKYCVSYGQLKGCYWTIPATSTQGTTKEGDKDYIARVALSPEINLELHKNVFLKFCESL